MPKYTLKEMVAALQSKAATPTSIVEESLKRIEMLNPSGNIFLSVNKEGALQAAKAAQQRLGQGENNPFLGIPVCIPDAVNFPPFPTTYGSKLFLDYFPTQMAVELQKMQALGMVVLGKTNLSEFGLDPETQNLLLPPTRNPLDPTLSSGGPNGGSAAAVAAGICPIAFATDFSGSIRLSASFCGLAGFVPSRGLLPLRPSQYVPLTERHFLRKGFIAQTVEDIELLFLPLTGKVKGEPGDVLRIAYSPDLGVIGVDPQVSGLLELEVERLRKAGHQVDIVGSELDPSMLVQFQNIVAVDRLLIVREALAKHPGSEFLLTEKTRQWLKYAEGVSGVSYSYAETYLDWVKDKVDQLLQPYDLLLTPVSPVLPYPLGKLPETLSRSLVDPWALTMPFNMSGHPVVSLPHLQLVGKSGSDAFLLAAAKKLF